MLWRGIAIALQLWDYNTGVFYLRPWFRFDAIAIGCYLALTSLRRSPKWLTGLSILGLAGWSLYGEALSRPLFITGQTLLAAVFLYGVVNGGPLTRAIFAQGWLRWLGGISYSLYLWQQIFTVSASKLGWLGNFPMNIICALALAVLSRQFIEQPFLKARRERVTNPQAGARESDLATARIGSR
jgi:peptidoglycan/LPS O-acetylase OafA/YrhL